MENSLPAIRLEDTGRYGRYYDENRFWAKIRKIAQKAGQKALEPFMLLYYTLKDGNVSLKNKAYIVGALGYFILPTDLLPDFIAGLGYTDDMAVAYLLIRHLKSSITPEIREKTDKKLKEITGNGDSNLDADYSRGRNVPDEDIERL
ncbi:MAG: DUF1232 domain-containing protein [Dysgonamonadaceae bacterium]|jgi:uncharacterized membrane protein YkvA (DUF1232 family)|nr:DUF1232 domain-containing protein [Dysgonamonadaceae bacterium]